MKNAEISLIKSKIKSCENKLKQERVILKAMQKDFVKKRDLKEVQRTCKIINKLENEIAHLNYLLMKLEV